MNVAIIDIGTNTFHMLIAEVGHSEPQVRYKTNEPVKLGEDLTRTNRIIPAAFERAISCLKKFKAVIEEHDVDLIKAVATSGVRSAENGADFVEAAYAAAGIKVDIIDGDEEADYIYQGIKWSGAISHTSLIMDIGGGSTEFILCDAEKLIWKKSYPIGAARLMQIFFQSDPIGTDDLSKIEMHLNQELKSLITACKPYHIQTLIGSAGAFESFATMITPEIDLDRIREAKIDYKSYLHLSEKLIASNHKERSITPKLIPLRVDMIVIACILTDYVLRQMQIQQIKLSTYDLKMGVLQSFE